jgi:LytS/YehU family sensor histidine kinase
MRAPDVRLAARVLAVFSLAWGVVIVLGVFLLARVTRGLSGPALLLASTYDCGGWAITSLAAYACASLVPPGGRRWMLVTIPAMALLLLATRLGILHLIARFTLYDPPGATAFAITLPGNLAMVVTFVAAGYALRAALRARAERVRRLDLDTWLARAQAGALQAQLHPHFLFNALNSVSALLRQSAAEAEHTLERIRDLLRASVTRPDTPWISLDEEIALVRTYLEIEAVRFGQRLRSEIRVETDIGNHPVPPLMLQPLVENALRHGIAPRPGGGTVWVTASAAAGGLRLTVEDDGVGIRPDAQSGAGTANTRARLHRLYGAAAVFEAGPRPGGGTVVRLAIPPGGARAARDPDPFPGDGSASRWGIAPLTGIFFALGFVLVITAWRAAVSRLSPVDAARTHPLYGFLELGYWIAAVAGIALLMNGARRVFTRPPPGAIAGETAGPESAEDARPPLKAVFVELVVMILVARVAILGLVPISLAQSLTLTVAHAAGLAILLLAVLSAGWMARYRSAALQALMWVGFAVLIVAVSAAIAWAGGAGSFRWQLVSRAPGYVATLANAFLVGYAIEHTRRASRIRLRERMREARTIRLELRALQEQVRPAVLFAAIDTVLATIRADATRADTLLARVADLMRAAVRRRPTHLVSVREEVLAARAIVALAEARHGRTFPVRIRASRQSLAARLPALLLAPLVESLIDREVGAPQSGGSLEIQIRVANGSLSIRARCGGRDKAALLAETEAARKRLRQCLPDAESSYGRPELSLIHVS